MQHEKVGEVMLPEGTAAKELLDEFDHTAEEGVYCPWANDCHTSVERAAENVGGKFVPNENYKGRGGK